MSDARFLSLAVPAVFAASVGLAFAAPASKPDVVELVPHRAVYDLKLATARGNKPVEIRARAHPV